MTVHHIEIHQIYKTKPAELLLCPFRRNAHAVVVIDSFRSVAEPSAGKNIVNLAQEMSLNVLLKKQKVEMQPLISLVAMNSLDQAEAISLSIL